MPDLETCRRNILSEDYRDFIENRTRTPLFNELLRQIFCHVQVHIQVVAAVLRGSARNFSFKIPVNRMPVVDTPAIIFQKNP